MSTNTLSSYNDCFIIQNYIADKINEESELSAYGLKALAENRMDIEFEIKKALSKQGMCILIITPQAKNLGRTNDRNVYNFKDLTIQIVENVAVNRASNKEYAATALDVGMYLQDFICGTDSIFGHGSFGFLGVEQGEENGLIVVKVKFQTYSSHNQ